MDNDEITNFYKLIYNSIDFCAIREPISFNLMRNLNIEAVESFDYLPLYIKNHYNFHNKKEDKVLLIAGSAKWLHLNILSDDKGTIEECEKSLLGFINYLNEMAEKGYKIEFLYEAKDYPAKDDREFIAFIEPRLSCKWSVITARSLDDWINCIEKASLLVSGRFHHTIAAYCVGTFFIALESNTFKIKGLMESLSFAEEVISWDDEDLTNTLLKRTETVQQKAFSPNVLEKLGEKAIQNFCGLQKFIRLNFD